MGSAAGGKFDRAGAEKIVFVASDDIALIVGIGGDLPDGGLDNSKVI